MYSISTPHAPRPDGPYSQGSSAARYLFVSAQGPEDPVTGGVVDGSIGVQTVRALGNMEAVLEEVGLGIEAVCKLTLWLTDLDDLPSVDEVLTERLEKPYPARSVCEVSRLPKGARIQIECVACR
ncbi:Rid family detoxifying hydrolase [Olsenella sp. YH-ols2217]|uniref:Rid family detoxifying hydrolase n=1 Tax=Kribbibacterium absianum TaxID=3044210 RepID=A0ABT6ZJ77_9ACTN|nr:MULTISPECIES: Rid family detoxifying hydrolase [unclassified Olsenella]MDJ1121462.1 Rid family detoxifying hydrolase [Olsenella sp. YH-ols2216]MDJ1128952.1 Rid family detoxifying hydrolase [Olsenella sp. YH-ols2217]